MVYSSAISGNFSVSTLKVTASTPESIGESTAGGLAPPPPPPKATPQDKERRRLLREAELKTRDAEKVYLKCERDVARLSEANDPAKVAELAAAYAALEIAESEWLSCLEALETL